MKRTVKMLTGVLVAVICVSVSIAQDKEKKPKLMGAEACKNCHKAKASGEQYTKWKEWKMAKSFETLASDKAKEIAKKEGIEDAQKSEKCLKCHQTGFGVDEKLLDKKFDKKMGVQCESCHGAAEKHVKNRMAEAGDVDEKTQHERAQKEMPLPTKEACSQCHNGEGPTPDKFWDGEKKEFKFEEALKEIDHHNPKYKKEKDR